MSTFQPAGDPPLSYGTFPFNPGTPTFSIPIAPISTGEVFVNTDPEILERLRRIEEMLTKLMERG